MNKMIGLILLVFVPASCSGGGGRRVAATDPRSDAGGEPGVVVLPPDSPKLQQLRVETVVNADVPTDEVVTPGKVEANPNRISRVLLPVPGRISSVLVKLGDGVSAGQPLLTLESPDADAAMSSFLQAAASLTQAAAAEVKAQADYARTSDLFVHSAIAKKEVLNAENSLTQAKAAIEQAQALREQARRRLEMFGLKPGDFGQRIVIRAPLAGKILEMSVAQGEYRNDTTVPVITIADLSTVWISADVPESYIRFVQTGERVDVTLAAYPGEAFRGRVARIADTVDGQTRTVKVRSEMDNSQGRLRPEMFGSVRHTESVRTTPVLPAGAVVQMQGSSVAFVETAAGRFKQTPVVVGDRFKDLLPVVSGIKAGDRVVVDGAMLLRQP